VVVHKFKWKDSSLNFINSGYIILCVWGLWHGVFLILILVGSLLCIESRCLFWFWNFLGLWLCAFWILIVFIHPSYIFRSKYYFEEAKTTILTLKRQPTKHKKCLWMCQGYKSSNNKGTKPKERKQRQIYKVVPIHEKG